MKQKKSLLGTVRLITTLFLLLLVAVIFLYEISFHKQDRRQAIEEAVDSYYSEQKSRLKCEIDRILERMAFQKEQVGRQTEREVKSRAMEGYSLARALYRTGRESHSEDDLKWEILNSLRVMTYRNGDGYYFVMDRDGTVLMNPGTPERKNVTIESQDEPGRRVAEEMMARARRDGQGYYSYDWHKSDSPDIWLRKSVYFITFEPYGWVIGTGLFEDDISRDLQRSLLQSIEYVFTDDPDYLFIGDWKGTMLLGPDSGVNYLEDSDQEKAELYGKFLATAEEGGFLEYGGFGGEGSSKLYYLRKTEDWNWFLGAGISTEDLERHIRAIESESAETMRKEMILLISITAMFFFVVIIFFKLMERSFSRDLDYFSRFFKQASTDNIPMEKDKLRFRELYDLGDYANRMVKEKKRSDREKQKHRNLESLSFLAAGIAHDFNNALMGIYGNIELAQLGIETGEDSLPYLERALEAMENTRKITARLLTFAEKSSHNSRSLSLDGLIGEGLNQWMDGDRRPEIHRHIPGGLTVRGDRDQLTLALTLLFTNAREAMGERGNITLRAEKTVLSKAFSSRLSGPYVKLEITDNGRGMDEETVEKVFDPYFSTKQTGRGLGLPTVFSILKHHRGYVDVASVKGTGTTVTLYIPEGEDQTS